tara:strand:- start:69 stop:365 length:297 start_codon:yes stop_codon:yes gene_type:complete
MKIKTKSVIIGKKKHKEDQDNMERPFFVSLFDVHEPHLSKKVPKERYDFEEGIHKIIIKDLRIDYLLAGNDILIDNLEEINFEEDKIGHLIVTGKQNL